MAIAETVKGALGMESKPRAEKPEREVEERVKRARERLRQLQPQRREAIEFANGNHYAYVDDKGKLGQQSTTAVSMGGEKPDHRVRLSRDLISPALKGRVSAASQRVPGYESVPTSPDSEDWSAAKLAGKIALGGYELWRLRQIHQKWIWNALVSEEGFARAYWDLNVGPFVEIEVTDEETGEPTGEMEIVGMGECAVRVYTGLEVGWEPGVDFEESRYITIEHARPVEDVEREAGFMGGKLSADAESAEVGTTGKQEAGSKQVMVTEYLERPCAQYPKGRRIIMAGGKVIFPEETYPRRDHEGNVVDEPCLHRLYYDIDGSSDRYKGLVRSLIESMREYNMGANKALEWIQGALAPQLLAKEGTVEQPITDEPLAVVEWKGLSADEKPEWREVPQVPRELFEVQDRAQATMGIIAHDNQVPPQVEAAKTVQALASKDALAWQDFIELFAEGAARLMRDLLVLVQRHYSEERLVKFRGRTGWENIADFKGADIRGQTDIRVPASSLEPRTRQQTEQRIRNIAQMFPGVFPPEVLISAMEGGSAEKLIEGYEDDVARANRIISLVRSGQFWNEPMRPVFPGEEAPKVDPQTGQPIMVPSGQMEPILAPGPLSPETGEAEPVQVGERPQMVPQMETELPGWMPRPFDNIPVQKAVLETWMKTDDWAGLDGAAQRATMMVYNAMLEIEARNAARQAQLQNQMAESQGMRNAAREPEKPMPSLPALNGAGGEDGAGI